MSQLDVVTISSVGALGAASAAVRQFLARLHSLGRTPPVDRDARVVAFLRSLDLDPAEHLDLDPAEHLDLVPHLDLAAPRSAPAPEPVG